MPLQVFGVVRQGHPAPSTGDAEGTDDTIGVRLVESGDLAAAVTDIDDEAQLHEEDATRHLDVLILLLREGPVLPLAFGTVSPDEDAVRAEVLDAAAAELTDQLETVDGYVEARLEIFFDEPAALREVMQADPEVRDLAAQTRGPDRTLDARIALGETVSMRLTEWRRQQAEALLGSLLPAVEDAAELESTEPLQQRWAFLVRTDRLNGLDEAVGRLRTSLQQVAAAVEYVGPLPVYSFLQPVQGAAPDPPSRSAWEAAPTQSRSAWGW